MKNGTKLEKIFHHATLYAKGVDNVGKIMMMKRLLSGIIFLFSFVFNIPTSTIPEFIIVIAEFESIFNVVNINLPPSILIGCSDNVTVGVIVIIPLVKVNVVVPVASVNVVLINEFN